MSITRQDLRDLAARFNPKTGRELDRATTPDEELCWHDATAGGPSLFLDTREAKRALDTGETLCRAERIGLSAAHDDGPLVARRGEEPLYSATEIRDDFTAKWWLPWALLAVAITVGLIIRAIWRNV